MGKRVRYPSLDFVRVASMLSVILLHTTSGYLFAESQFTLRGVNLGFILNQGVRYCVPLFILLSGLSLSLSGREEKYGDFIWARGKKILIPYLIWTTLYFWVQTDSLNVAALLKALFYGSAAPHLYFIVALIQLYLFYVPLRRLLKKHPVSTLLTAFFLTLALQWIIYLSVFDIHLVPEVLRVFQVRFFGTWLFLFVLGMFLAKYWDRLRGFSKRYALGLSCAFLLFAGLYILDSYGTDSYELSIKPILFFYVPLALCTFVGMGEQLAKSKACITVLAFLSKHSMTVFFCHIFVLEKLREHGEYFLGMSGMLFLSLLVIVISIIAAFLIDSAVGILKRALPKSGQKGSAGR